jgi:hypothetical protein
VTKQGPTKIGDDDAFIFCPWRVPDESSGCQWGDWRTAALQSLHWQSDPPNPEFPRWWHEFISYFYLMRDLSESLITISPFLKRFYDFVSSWIVFCISLRYSDLSKHLLLHFEVYFLIRRSFTLTTVFNLLWWCWCFGWVGGIRCSLKGF